MSQSELSGEHSPIQRNHLLRRRPFKLLLALPALLYVAVAVFWQSNNLYPITGDEPHYLLIADSLIRDHDLLVYNEYFINTPVQQDIRQVAPRIKLAEAGYLQQVTPLGFSIHGIGLSFVLLIPYWIGGVTGAKVFLALLAGLFPLLFYRTAHQVTESEFWSIVIALSLSIGLPFLAASNQIYPDLVGGLIILFVAERVVGILTGRYERRFTSLSSFGIGILVLFLPWLNVRLGAAAFVLLVSYIYVVLGVRSDQAHYRLRYWLIPVATFTLSTILLLCYNHIVDNNNDIFRATGYLSFDIKQDSMFFLGLHWDQAQGMFMQQPLLLLGLVGVAPLIKANWRVALLLGALYLSVLLLNSTCFFMEEVPS